MSVRKCKASNAAATPSIKKVLEANREALVIVTNPDPANQRSSNMSVYTKVANKNGVLLSYLQNVLTHLIRNDGQRSKGKTGHSNKGKTGVGA